MSALLVPNIGEVQLLTMALKKATVEGQTLKLFTNNHVPADADTASDYTEPAGTSGYVAQAIARADWAVTTGVDGISTAAASQKVFDFTSGLVSVYGYFVVEATSGVLLWAERFDAPANIPVNGGSIRITPKLTLSQPS